MKFDPTISLGTLVSLAVFIVGLVVAWGKFQARLGALEVKVDALWRKFIRNHVEEEVGP